MTTIHAVLRGASPAAGRYLPMTLRSDDGDSMALMAPREEFRKALKETGGVGRFELTIGDDPTVHHAIAKLVEKGSTPDSFLRVIVQEVHSSDVIRMQVLLRVNGLPSSTTTHTAQVIQKARHVLLRGAYADLPEKITVDLTQLDKKETFCAGDLELPTGLELAGSPDDVLFTVRQLVTAKK